MSQTTIYAYATTWQKGNMHSINLGYCGADSQDAALGIAVRTGISKNPDCVMTNNSIIKVEAPVFENYDKAVGALEEIAKLLGLNPDEIEVDDLLAVAKQKLAAPLP